MPAEWQARQLLLIASDPGPGNILPGSGRSTVTDFRVSVGAAPPANGTSMPAARSARGRVVRNMGGPPQAATTGVDSMTLRMNPAGFQLGRSGCATPSLLVQRTISV